MSDDTAPTQEAAKELKPYQKTAVESLCDYFLGTRAGTKSGGNAQRTVVAYGGVGCGKTIISVSVAKELRERHPDRFARVLVVAPSCGGAVMKQWGDEIAQDGLGVLCYQGHSPKERAALREKWSGMGSGIHFLVTSIHAIHADARLLLESSVAAASTAASPKKRKRVEFSNQQWKDAHMRAAKALGGFDLVVVDEFQTFRNGSPPSDVSRAVDENARMYNALLALVQSSPTCKVLGLSATPVVNQPSEFTSFFQLGAGDSNSILEMKAKLLRTNGYGSTDFAEESRRIRNAVFVKIEPPPMPETKREVVAHGYTPREVAVLSRAYAELADKGSRFLGAIADAQGNKNNVQKQSQLLLCKRQFFSMLTKATRMTISPLLFDVVPQRDDPIKFPALDAAGEVLMVKGDMGPIPLGRLRPMDIEAAHKKEPLQEVSKFSALIDRLRDIKDQRVMVLAEYSDPLDILALYINDEFPGRPVFKFHGGVSGRDKQLANFKVSAPNAILLATRGSCGMAVNVECTTTRAERLPDGSSIQRRIPVLQFSIDVAGTKSSQNQAEGRIKRPIAQGFGDVDGVTEWRVQSVLATEFQGYSLEQWAYEKQKVKDARCSELLNANPEDELTHDKIDSDDDKGLTKILSHLVTKMSVYAPKGVAKKCMGLL